MCGIAGIYSTVQQKKIDADILAKMIGRLRHRGPDEDGFHINSRLGLGQSRLSIIDLSGGKQPIYNEDKSICVIFNGEIFNYVELGQELRKLGHYFQTHSDTEVIVHAYEQYGMKFLAHLVGQFAIALWDNNTRELILARDRVGIRPLFYTTTAAGNFMFASEIKALFSDPELIPEIDPAGINQILTLWVNIPPRTVFKGISELPPGHYMRISDRGIKIQRFWKLEFPPYHEYDSKPLSYYTKKIEELLFDAITIRLRADVPVASYLSGGIDSSIITALVKKHHNNDLLTFSVAFHESSYDEREHQQIMIEYLKTDHRMIEANYSNISEAFSDVVWYAEKPMIRTAPAPLFLLSRLVRQNQIKVVLTGEGADEVFAGYNIFKEDKLRRFWARNPDSKWRPRLLSRLYPYINVNKTAQTFWQSFFKKDINNINNRYYSHTIRWNNTAQIKNLLTKELRSQFNDEEQIYAELDSFIDPEITTWHPLCRAQYLEMQLFLSGYLLSTQGDRMMMGNSVEGRFPFLDHRVIEFANTIPPEYKLHVLNEKYILKKTYEHLLPETVVKRAKQPYRAPIFKCFSKDRKTPASRMIEPEKIEHYGYFDLTAVTRLLKKTEHRDGESVSAREDMAIAFLASLQLLHHHFIENRAVKS